MAHNQCDPVLWNAAAIKLADEHTPQAVEDFPLSPFLAQSLTFGPCKTLCVPCRAFAVCTFSYAGMIEQEAAVIVLDKLFNESLQLAMNGNQASRITCFALRHLEAPNPFNRLDIVYL